TCKRGSPPPPLQSRLPAEIGPKGPIFFSRSKTTDISAAWFVVCRAGKHRAPAIPPDYTPSSTASAANPPLSVH
ncbi:hypothetical protein, partial [Cronobacter sakazakii]|uniref:hypothetical protein n=1 Tax=Cronobacter sakazakii TaxID=28141 RepID=UPI00195EF705